MEVQPPWASELLARNRKVARNIRWSTSLDTSSTSSSSIELRINSRSQITDGIDVAHDGCGDVLILRNTIVVQEGREGIKNGPGEVHGKGTLVKGGKAAKIVRIVAKDEGKVVDPLLIEASSTASAANSRTDSDEGDDSMMKNKNGDDGSFEYGPGIVMKLRSKYQSLALRQHMGRPTLRRSASLENCLDQGCDNLIGGTPSPTPRYNNHNEEDEVDGRSRRLGPMNNNVTSGNRSVSNKAASQQQYQQRGRSSGHSDYNNRDRMRRARSVDALHRCSTGSGSNRQSEEKEILEKFKNVVLPKEEIVIIEVSTPRANFGTIYASDIDDRQSQFSRSLHHHQHNNLNGNSNGSELNGVRSLASPEHELPPHDIVRETARIFEKNQDSQTSQNNYNNSNQHINGFKKVGHALRLSKSSSSNSGTGGGSPNSSPLPSPTGTSGVVHTSGSMNGQGGSPYQVQNKGHLSAQGLNTCTASNGNSNSLNNSSSSANHKGNKLGDGRNNNFISNGHTTSSSVNSKSSSVASNLQSNNNYSGTSNLSSKQVGVIRPTVTTTAANSNTSNSSVVTGGPVINGHIAKRNPTNKSHASSPLSASSSVKSIEDSASMDGGGSSNNTSSSSAKKPPLGPKPLLSSAPNNIFLKNDKTVSSAPNTTMTESSVVTPSAGAKSPEPDSDRARSPTSPSATSSTDNIPTKSFSLNKTMEIPLGVKESNEVMAEFQQITLKPVAKPKDHSEIILNTTSSKNFTPNKTTELNTKTDNMKDPKMNNNSNATKGSNNATSVATTKKSAPVQQPQPAQVPLRKTPSPTLPKDVSPEDPPKREQKIPHQQQPLSQLRTHQQQKLEKQKNTGGGETMVFNFTNRQKVPDYIEDDGLHNRVQVRLSGTVTDESHDDTDDADLGGDSDYVDAKMYQFEGGNVIINGRSSIQKKPKSQKLNISFNEEAITTFEYPSEASVLGDDDTDSNNKENPLGHKTPNILNSGSGLGSYTPSKIGNSYQLGSYTDRNVISPKKQEKKAEDITNELIEDYLKPDTVSTTWSSEMGADILF